MSVKQLKRVTPTFQAVLNKQIGKAMDAIDEGNLEHAYAVLKTLIDALKPEDSDELLKNEVAHIDALLEKASQSRNPNFYMTLLETSSQQEQVLLQNIRRLFRKIMRILHQGGYLEIHKRPVETNVPDEVFLSQQ